MQISVAHPNELGPDDLAAWRSMQHKTASLASPFLAPEFTLAVGNFRPNARVAVLSDGPELVGFFPFERRRLGVGVPIGAGLNNCQGLIHAPAMEWDPRALLRACRVSVWQFDSLVAGQKPFEPYAARMTPLPVIDLADGFEIYQEKLRVKSPKFCREVARKARKLEREAGELRFVLDSRDAAGLHALICWKSDQYRRNGMVDIFDRPWVVGLVDQLFSTRNGHFSGLLSVLYAGEMPVAAQFGLRSGHLLGGWFCAYDSRFGRQSPGLLQHVRTVQEAPALGVYLIDMGIGSERYKQTLKSYDLSIGAGTVAQGPVLAGAHQARSAATDWARRQIRKHPPLFHAADKLLRHYGRVG